jgi:hypothetical protein
MLGKSSGSRYKMPTARTAKYTASHGRCSRSRPIPDSTLCQNDPCSCKNALASTAQCSHPSVCKEKTTILRLASFPGRSIETGSMAGSYSRSTISFSEATCLSASIFKQISNCSNAGTRSSSDAEGCVLSVEALTRLCAQGLDSARAVSSSAI